jgi:AraC-like DNA-binding protein
MNNNDLAISSIEKRRLRKHKIKVGSIHLLTNSGLQQLLGISKIRAMELRALSEFQSLPSVGPRFAHDLIALGFYSLKDLKGKDAAKLLDKFERLMGVWADPCMEDQFRMVVHFANHPGVHKNWWDFTPERKAFRAKNGYPKTRPKKAWHELPQYQLSSGITAINETTKIELAQKLKNSVKYMNQHYDQTLSLMQIAKAAAISKHHYLRQFKNAYEITPIQYLTNIRLKNATRLLKAKKLSIAQIGHQCGFENESAFIRVFKSRFSTTPLQFKKNFQTRT